MMTPHYAGGLAVSNAPIDESPISCTTVELVGNVEKAQEDLLGTYVMEEADDDRHEVAIYKKASKDSKVAFFLFYDDFHSMWAIGPVAGSHPYIVTCKSLNHLHPETLSSGWMMANMAPVRTMKASCHHTHAPTLQPTTAAPTPFRLDLGVVGADAAVAKKEDSGAPEVVLGVWKQVLDKNTGAFFYFNTKTQETQIKPPLAFQKLIAQSKSRAFNKAQAKEVAKEKAAQRDAQMLALYAQYIRPFIPVFTLLGLLTCSVLATWYGLQSAWQSSKQKQHKLQEAATKKVRIPTIYKKKMKPKKDTPVPRTSTANNGTRLDRVLEDDDEDDDGEALVKALEVPILLATYRSTLMLRIFSHRANTITAGILRMPMMKSLIIPNLKRTANTKARES
jgi:hypothetical protein